MAEPACGGRIGPASDYDIGYLVKRSVAETMKDLFGRAGCRGCTTLYGHPTGGRAE